MKLNQITMPADLAEVVALHREMFGGWVMEDDGDGADGNETPGGEGGANESADGFPANTPVKDMTAEQQAAYWKHKARKHEARAEAARDTVKAERDRLKQATMTDDQKAIEQARNEAAEAARTEERAKLLGQVVKAELRGALTAKKIEAARINAALGPIDTKYFLTDSGEVDTDKVTEYADGFAPAGTQWPDTGQGKRGSNGPAKGVDAGRDLYRDRHT